MIRKIAVFILVLLPLLLSACEELPPLADPTEALLSFPIDPRFREIYDRMGGEQVLGRGYSPKIQDGNLECQYTRNAMMVFDASELNTNRYALAPIGLMLNVKEAPIPAPANLTSRYVDGYVIFSEFVPFRDSREIPFIGRPISHVHFDPNTDQYTQYFENVGLVRTKGDPPDRVQLLPYGDWTVNSTCRPMQNNRFPPVDPQFSAAAAGLGPIFTGYPLLEARVGLDGRVEQVFENVVLAVDVSQPGQYSLVPLSDRIGILAHPKVPDAKDPNKTFIPIDGEKGYNVPNYFLAYLKQHGSLQTSGMPITELVTGEGDNYRQCFQNLCLVNYLNDPDGLGVRPEPLGYKFRSKYYSEAQVQPTSTAPSNTVVIQIDMPQQAVATSQEQLINITVTSGVLPVTNAAAFIRVTYPDGSQSNSPFPLTDANGRASITLPPIQAPNLTLVPFQVCINQPGSGEVCNKSYYMISNIP